MLSVVVPIHNEEPSILPLYDRLTAVMERLRKPYEIIFTDDASTDRSFDLLANLVETDHRLKVIRRTTDDLQHVRRGYLLLQGLVALTHDLRDVCFSANNGGILRPLRLSGNGHD